MPTSCDTNTDFFKERGFAMRGNASSFVGDIPEHYDKGLGPVLFHHYGDDIAKRVVDTKASSVLELAAGTGIVTRKLRDALTESISLLATDLNQPMLDISAGKFEQHENIGFQTADAMELPFTTNSYDAIICQFGVMFFPDKERSYHETRRVLRDGGSYIFSVWGSWAANPFAKLTHETIAAFFDGQAPTFYEVPFGYDDVDSITTSLLAAGFANVKAERLSHTAAIKDIPAFAKALIFGNPIADEIRGLGGNPDDAVNKVEAAIIGEFGTTQSMPLEAVVFTAS
ncbi:MAG: ubiquinone/menaquinone biosynthesis C-methylase UbiE [Gammaproteobacteria bacterium]|jgi:ubiquinone/menaquinone biosynthesis C-methylase UbiE